MSLLFYLMNQIIPQTEYRISIQKRPKSKIIISFLDFIPKFLMAATIDDIDGTHDSVSIKILPQPF